MEELQPWEEAEVAKTGWAGSLAAVQGAESFRGLKRMV